VLTNRSSGRMGYAVAAELARRGAEVDLVAGPGEQPDPPGVTVTRVETAEEMYRAVTDRISGCGIFVGAAAVADYRPAEVPDAKIKKNDDTLTLHLVKNPDILQAVAAMEHAPFTVGFAAETHAMQAHAEEKRRRKGLDMIAANWVGRPEGGFDTEDNALEVTWEGGGISLGPKAKTRLAAELVDVVAERYRQQTAHDRSPA
jgi:phosphopantothenoylcysteine decarboxylase/phosphopantothenate--cysteine ligase